LTDKSANKRLLKFNQKYKQDLKHMKKQEKESDEPLSQGRLRWFNQEIDRIDEKIKELASEVE